MTWGSPWRVSSSSSPDSSSRSASRRMTSLWATDMRGQSLSAPLRGRPRPVVVQAKELDHAIDVGLFANEHADPARLRMHVMRLGLPRRHQLLANQQRKRKVDQLVAMDMSEFSAPVTELDAAEAVRP